MYKNVILLLLTGAVLIVWYNQTQSQDNKMEYSKSYDPKKVLHDQVPTKLGKYMIDIDVELSQLLQRINQFEEEPLTTLSCQHSVNGWTRIDFSYQGYEKFIRMLRSQYMKKYSLEYPLQGLYGRIIYKEGIKQSLMLGEYSGE
jgi:hypothetical protein